MAVGDSDKERRWNLKRKHALISSAVELLSLEVSTRLGFQGVRADIAHRKLRLLDSPRLAFNGDPCRHQLALLNRKPW